MRSLAVELRALPGVKADPQRTRSAASIPTITAPDRRLKAANSAQGHRGGATERSAISRYFADVGLHPLLTKDGEVACGIRMKAGRLALFEALVAWPGLYRTFREWRAQLVAGASPYRLRAISEETNAERALQTEESEPEDDNRRDDDEHQLRCERHRNSAIAAIDMLLGLEGETIGHEMVGRSDAGRAVAEYGLLAPQFKSIVDAIQTDAKTLRQIDGEAARVARKAGYDSEGFASAWLGYDPPWRADRAQRMEPAAHFEGQVEFAAVLSRLAGFSKQVGMSIPSFRRVLSLVNSAIGVIETAKQEMVAANMRLVITMAKQLKRRGVPFDDLIQEGNLGLLRAVESYDHTLGYKFASYASWWIEQSMVRAIADQARTIRYPVHLVDKMSKVRVAMLVFQQRNGRRPTEKEIIKSTGLKPWVVKRCLEAATTVSLDEPIGNDEDGTTRGDLIEDTQSLHPDSPLLHDDLRRKLSEVVSTLPDREALIIRKRFGLEGDEHSFEELGIELDLSRERIRQLEGKALQILKIRAGRRGLRSLLHGI